MHEQWYEQTQFAETAARRENFGETGSRPSAAGQRLIEAGRPRAERSGACNASTAPDGGVFEQPLERRLGCGVASGLNHGDSAQRPLMDAASENAS